MAASVGVLAPFAIAHATAPLSGLSQQDRVARNRDYFDALLSLLPARILLKEGRGAADGQEEDSRFFKQSKGATVAARAQHKVKAGDAKRVRFDVAGHQSTSQRIEGVKAPVGPAPSSVSGHKRKRAAADSDNEDGDDDDSDGDEEMGDSRPSTSAAGSIDDLRARLAARIQGLKQSRQLKYREWEAPVGEKDGPVRDTQRERKRFREKKEKERTATEDAAAETALAGSSKGKSGSKAADAKGSKKIPYSKGAAPGVISSTSAAPSNKRARTSESTTEGESSSAPPATPTDDIDLDFAFGAAPSTAGRRTGGSTEGSVTEGGDRKTTKRDRLKKMLSDAQKTQRKLEKLKESGDDAGKLDMQFATAMRRAEGGKVHDDPKLLAKSLKRMEKTKGKSAASWATRTSQVAEKLEERIGKRNDNLKTKKFRSQLKAAERVEAQKAAERHAKLHGTEESGGAAGAGGKSGDKSSGGGKHRAGFEGRSGGKSGGGKGFGGGRK